MSYNDDELRKPHPSQAQIARMRKNSQLSNEYISRFISSLKEKNGDPLLIAALEKQSEDAKLLVIEQGKRNQLEARIAELSLTDAQIRGAEKIRHVKKHRSTTDA